MHGVSFGLNNLPGSWGHAGRADDARMSGMRGSHHVDGHSLRNTRTSESPLAQTLANLSTSVSTLRDQLDSLATTLGLSDAANGISASGFGAQVISKAKGELQIHTQEGDLVTLKFSSKLNMSYDSAQVSDGTTTATAAALDVSSRSRIGVSVQGDLNDEELAAITDLVGKVGDLTASFYSGDTESAITQALSMTYDTTQLADYSLDLSLKQSVTAYAYQAQLPAANTASTSASTDNETATTSTLSELGAVSEDVPSLMDLLSEVLNPQVPADSSDAPVAADAAEVLPTTNEVAEVPVDAAANVPATESLPVADAVDASGSADPTAAIASPTDDTATTESVSNTAVLAEFVAKVRAAFQITSNGDASLGINYEMKVHVLMSSIASSAPATTPDDATLDSLQQYLTTPNA